MVVFDTSILTLVFDSDSKPPTDPDTGLPVTDCQARLDYLIKRLAKAKQRVLIPTPVLAEYLVRAGADKDKRFDTIIGSRVFVVSPFDTRAAVECAGIEDNDYRRIRAVPEADSRAKVKFDRQIIAIAIARGASVIYTGDISLASRARRSGLDVVMTWELALPPVEPQFELELTYGADESDAAQLPLAASSDSTPH
jgi:rRNA-processing protein FCF1